ncbi:MAG: hypothetical protein IJX80_11180 [Clostridia bacterium]|nr:hypothetical protein [Clostridia bacterium]
MEKKEILYYLCDFIESKQKNETDKKTERLLSVLKSVTEEAISFGDAPSYFFAYIECNSTGVGTSSFQGTETQRTVARDYVTDEYLFIDGHVNAGAKGLSLFFLNPNQTINYYKKSDIVKVAKEFGFRIHLQYFQDLNFTLSDHRLNRHTVKITKGPFTYPIRPIFATVSEQGEKITIGYIYEKDGQEYIIIEPEDYGEVRKKAHKSGCAPWMLFGLVFPPIFLVALLVWMIKAKKERMVG